MLPFRYQHFLSVPSHRYLFALCVSFPTFYNMLSCSTHILLTLAGTAISKVECGQNRSGVKFMHQHTVVTSSIISQFKSGCKVFYMISYTSILPYFNLFFTSIFYITSQEKINNCISISVTCLRLQNITFFSRRINLKRIKT